VAFGLRNVGSSNTNLGAFGVNNDDISKSVYVFSAPRDPTEQGPRKHIVSRVPGKPKKHFQVIFVNTPTNAPPPQHSIELPPSPETKTLVSVL